MESNSVTGKINISENTFQLKIILLVNTEGNSSKKQGHDENVFC
jgi:hypothetical protein